MISINVQVETSGDQGRVYGSSGACERVGISRGQCTDVDSGQAETRSPP
jgi:hypothetical protein